MTTELEKQFFECFGIEPKHNDGCRIADKYWNNEKLANKYGTFDIYMDKNCVEEYSGACFSTCEFAYDNKQYPKITDRQFLELIAIVNNYSRIFLFRPTTYSEVKEEIINECIELSDNVPKIKQRHTFKQKVKALFEGEE